MSSCADFTHEDVLRILEIVDSATDVEVRVEINGLKLHVQKFSGTGPAPVARLPEPAPVAPAAEPVHEPLPPEPAAKATTPPLVAEPSAAIQPAAGTEIVYAPTLGRFFRSPSPLEPAYVEVGSKVDPDDPVCLLEVMKVFSTVRAGVKGTIKEILVSNEEMVEQGQPLFVIALED